VDPRSPLVTPPQLLHCAPMSTILVTGGCGFIGTRTVSRLVAEGHQVVVADYLHPQVHADTRALGLLPDGVRHHLIDVTHSPSMDALLRVTRPDVIIHLAAETGTGQSLTESSRHGSVNVVGTTNLLDACTRAEVVPASIVLTSSRAVYGEGAWVDESGDGSVFHPAQRNRDDLAAGRWNPPSPSGGPASPLPNRAGTTETRPTNVYAATKLAQEHIVSAWCTSMGTSSHILRLQNVYGPGQSPTNSYTGVLTYFAVRAVAGDTIEVFEDGDIGRDFVYIDDVVSAVTGAAARRGPSSLIDVGSGTRSTILEAAQLIANAANAPEPVVTGAYRLGDVRSAWAAPTDGDRTPLADGLVELVRGMSERSSR
jgi:dTDP-L-rhamnose 4-epimerase